jgi:HEAT repeat protein
VPALCAAARGGSVFVAPPALEALGEIGDPRALPTLARVLNGMGVETALRMAAAQALGKMGHPGAVRPLLEALGTSYTGLFVEVCRALARIKSPEAVPALCGAAEHAGRLDASHLAIAALCEALEIAARLGYPEAAPVAFEAPQHFGAHALPALAVVLEKGSTGAKVRALELLQGFGSTEAAAWEMVAGSLQDRQEPVRLAALLTLTRCPEASFELRARPLLEDASRRVRAVAAVALYGWGPAPDLLPGVLEALGDPDPLVVTAAAEVLERCGRERPAAYLREAILPLRRRSGSLFRRLPAEAQRACRGALKAVERATAGVRDLPLPSTSRTSSADLPRPAQPAPPEPEGLPIPQPGKGLPG